MYFCELVTDQTKEDQHFLFNFCSSEECYFFINGKRKWPKKLNVCSRIFGDHYVSFLLFIWMKQFIKNINRKMYYALKISIFKLPTTTRYKIWVKESLLNALKLFPKQIYMYGIDLNITSTCSRHFEINQITLELKFSQSVESNLVIFDVVLQGWPLRYLRFWGWDLPPLRGWSRTVENIHWKCFTWQYILRIKQFFYMSLSFGKGL